MKVGDLKSKKPSTIQRKFQKLFSKDRDFKEIAKGGSIAFLINLFGIVIGYLFVTLVSRIYKDSAASIYGQYVLITLLLRIGSIVTRFGTDTAMLRLTAALATKNLWGNIIDSRNKLLKILFSFGLLVTLVMVLFSNQWGAIFKISGETIRIGSFFIIPMALALFFSQSLRGLKKVGISSFLRNSAMPVINFILLPIGVLLVSKNSEYYSHLPSYTFFAAVIISLFIGFYFWNKAVPKNEILKVEEEHYKTVKNLFSSSYPLLLAESMIFIGTWVDQLMLGAMGNNEDVGIFNLCVKYAMVSSLSLQAVNTISAPKFSEYFFKKDYSGLATNVKQTTKIIFYTTLPIVILYLIFPHFFLGLFGDSFTKGTMAFVFLAIGSLVSVMTGSVGVLLQMTGHQKVVQNILLVSIVLEVLLNALLIPLFGVTGAAVASMVCTVLKNLGMAYFVKKYFHFSSIYIPFISKV